MGKICDDRWDINDANVVCRQLGLPPATQAFRRATLGRGSGQIWIDDIRCSGYELHIDECNHGGWGNHNCVHYEDTSVECSSIISWSGEFYCNLRLELLTRMSLKDKEAEFLKFLEFFFRLWKWLTQCKSFRKGSFKKDFFIWIFSLFVEREERVYAILWNSSSSFSISIK